MFQNKLVRVGILLFILTLCAIAFAQEDSNQLEITEVHVMVMGLLGGLTFFLYGMESMSKGMKKVAGEQMRYFLSALTQNRFVALVIGAIVTMVIQSSSATTVMLVGFVHSGLMSFAQTLGVILGADIGTTFTVQLVAFKITKYALWMVSIGFGMNIISRKRQIKNWGEVLMGMGILFFGMKLMSDSMEPLKSFNGIYKWMSGLENPVLGVLIGSFFTAIIQSSAAFIGIVIILAQQKLITLEAGIALTMGANLGTCITAFLASINTMRDAKRVALAHVLFKVFGILIFITWIPTFADFVKYMSSSYKFGVSRQIANAHTFFNVGLAFLFLPFLSVFEKIIMRMLPEKKLLEGVDDFESTLKVLDKNLKKTPSVALNVARMELSRLSLIVIKLMNQFLPPFVSDKSVKEKLVPYETIIEELRIKEEEIDKMERAISGFLLEVSKEEISIKQSNEVYALMSIARDFESVGDIVDRNIIPLIKKKQDLNEDFSKEGQEEITIYHLKVIKQLGRLKDAFQELDIEKANTIMKRMERNIDLESQYRIKHYMRVQQKVKKSIETHEVHMELLDILKQINVYAGNMAKSIIRLSNL